MVSRQKFKEPKIIQPGRGRRRWWLVVVLVPLMLLGTAWYANDYGRASVHFDNVAAGEKAEGLEQQVAKLEQQVTGLESERVELRQQVAALGRASQIDREAAREVREEIKAIQEERLEMEEELVFLRGIVSNSADSKSLRIQGFKLEATENRGVYRYGFTVTQALSNKGAATGSIWITLVGTREGKEESMPLEALTGSRTESLKMQFTHFQEVEGLLQLPEGFVASNMTVDIKPSNKKLSRLTETFEWSVEG